MSKNDPTSIISRSLVYLRCYNLNEENEEIDISIGTGFCVYSEKTWVLFTNKHVIKDCKYISMMVNKLDPDSGESLPLKIIVTASTGVWRDHPDPDVDLCGLAMSSIQNSLKKINIDLYVGALNTDIFITDLEANELDWVEDILVCGYPNGIWDEVNNSPIFRRGITATDISKDYEGFPEFVIDCAIYPGSSGSPVLIYNRNMYPKGNQIILQSRTFLVGIVTDNFNHFFDGTVRREKVSVESQRFQSKVKISMPNQLGIVLKAKKILELLREFEETNIPIFYISHKQNDEVSIQLTSLIQ